MILIVPCFNEARRLPTNEFIAKFHMFDAIVFVNDGSSDDTAAVLKDLCKKIGSNCHVKELHKNFGKGEAIRQGIFYALETLVGKQEGIVKQIGFMDADLSTPLEEVARLGELQLSRKCGLLQGSRVSLMGRNIQRSALKHYLGRIGATLISELLKLPVYDTQAGIKIIDITAINTLFREPFISTWLFDCELYLRAFRAGIPCYEEPLEVWIDKTEDSKISASSYFIALADLLKIYRYYQ
jgi:dolichyl-phosphate beta-glucosyltransferase